MGFKPPTTGQTSTSGQQFSGILLQHKYNWTVFKT